jgi:ribonuclease HI
MAKKFYVVWVGRQTGIFTDWETCERHTKQFQGSKFKSFPTREEAEQAFKGSPSAARSSPAMQKPSITISPASAPVKAAPFEFSAGVDIFSDGACRGNPGEAGSGLAIYREGALSELWYGLYTSLGTNNTGELLALHHALLIAREELVKGHAVVVHSDSTYAISSITEWAHGWERKQWMDGTKPRKNAEIIKPMYELYRELNGVGLKIKHVRGHQGIEGNELADRMAARAIEDQESELRRYTDPLDIEEILSFTPG